MLLISHKSSDDFKKFLKDNNFDYITTIDNPKLDKRIADHPDLSFFNLDDNNIVIDKNLKSYYKDKITNKNIIWGDSTKIRYPYDSIYNLYKGSDFYIHNDITESNIKDYMDKHSYKHYYIKQGYTRCSIVPMGDKILTSDYGIYKTLKDKIDVVLLKPERIDLDGFDQGFLGGTCGLCNDALIFNGDIERLSSFDIIRDEANKSNIKLLYPKDIDLVDLGSIISL